MKNFLLGLAVVGLVFILSGCPGAGADSSNEGTSSNSDSGNSPDSEGTNEVQPVYATGIIDDTFQVGSGADNTVYGLAVHPNGKIIIGGSFTSYNGTAINRIARLNSDGSLDTTFSPGSGANGDVVGMVVLEDGKLLINGSFTTYNGFTRQRVARINSDGSLDANFQATFSDTSSVMSISVQSNGKIVVGGTFTSCNGVSRNYIARINPDGSLDTDFNPGTGANANGWVYSTALQQDGKILIGGAFTTYNGFTANRIARLNPDGSLDTTFNATGGANGDVRRVLVQKDDRIVITGSFTTYNGISRPYIARLLPNGSLDTDFIIGTGANSSVYEASLQPDGKIFIGGSFTSYNGTAINRIARLNSDGSLDTTFSPGSGAVDIVYGIRLQNDGKVILGGKFFKFNDINWNRIIRLR